MVAVALVAAVAEHRPQARLVGEATEWVVPAGGVLDDRRQRTPHVAHERDALEHPAHLLGLHRIGEVEPLGGEVSAQERERGRRGAIEIGELQEGAAAQHAAPGGAAGEHLAQRRDRGFGGGGQGARRKGGEGIGGLARCWHLSLLIGAGQALESSEARQIDVAVSRAFSPPCAPAMCGAGIALSDQARCQAATEP